MNLNTEQKQIQQIAPVLQQSLQLLRMSGQELLDYVKAQVAENPLLADLGEPQEAYYGYGGNQSHAENDGWIKDPLSDANQLSTELKVQLEGEHICKDTARLVDFMIDCLDERGYMPCSTAELAGMLNLAQDIVRTGLRILQSLEPAGVGARSLRECLLLQLKRLKPPPKLAMRIVRDYLSLLHRDSIPELYAILDARPQQIECALAIIRSLNPYPANGYETTTQINYIVPDIFVEREENGSFSIRLNELFLPRIHIEAPLLEPGHGAADYLSECRQRALHLKSIVHHREETLTRLMQTLVAEQQEFFRYGAHRLHPLTMEQVAQAVSLHVSTVSRAASSKYFRCAWGTFPIRMLFLRGAAVSGKEQTIYSAEQLRQRIRSMIQKEDKNKPLSDEQIAKRLAADAIPLSRRCVAKYRTEMSIPCAQGRRTPASIP
jgi:RNA polymerase sigma-54 factor